MRSNCDELCLTCLVIGLYPDEVNKAKFTLLIWIGVVTAFGLSSLRAHAEDERKSGPYKDDYRIAATLLIYGAAAGTGAGLVMYPVTGSSRAIWAGVSVGLFLGAVAGVYHLTRWDDPGNPFLAQQTQQAQTPALFSGHPDQSEPALFHASYSVVRF